MDVEADCQFCFLLWLLQRWTDVCAEIVMKHPGQWGVRGDLLNEKASVFSFSFGGGEGLSILT